MHLRNAILCTSAWSKARGLMFSKKKTLVFAFEHDMHVPLHMWFVFFPIDVLYLDKHKKIIEMKSNFKPFTFYTPKVKARYVVEVPYGVDAHLGEKISWGRRDLNPD